MLSYKEWKTINESLDGSTNLGITNPHNMGIASAQPTQEEFMAEMKRKLDEAKAKMKKKMDGDLEDEEDEEELDSDGEVVDPAAAKDANVDADAEAEMDSEDEDEDEDESGCASEFMKKKQKKKMKGKVHNGGEAAKEEKGSPASKLKKAKKLADDEKKKVAKDEKKNPGDKPDWKKAKEKAIAVDPAAAKKMASEEAAEADRKKWWESLRGQMGPAQATVKNWDGLTPVTDGMSGAPVLTPVDANGQPVVVAGDNTVVAPATDIPVDGTVVSNGETVVVQPGPGEVGYAPVGKVAVV